jgi:hypothetical protein
MTDKQWIIRFIVTTVLTAAGTIIIGLIFYQSAIFKIDDSAFQFVSFGIVGGIIFSTFRFLSKRQAAAAIVLLLLLDMVLQRSTVWKFMLRDVLYYFGFTAAIFVFAYYYFEKLRGIVVGRILVLGSVMALGYVAITVILYLIFLSSSNEFGPNVSQMIYFNLSQGFLVGFGLGVGIEGAELIWGKNKRGGGAK